MGDGADAGGGGRSVAALLARVDALTAEDGRLKAAEAAASKRKADAERRVEAARTETEELRRLSAEDTAAAVEGRERAAAAVAALEAARSFADALESRRAEASKAATNACEALRQEKRRQIEMLEAWQRDTLSDGPRIHAASAPSAPLGDATTRACGAPVASSPTMPASTVRRANELAVLANKLTALRVLLKELGAELQALTDHNELLECALLEQREVRRTSGTAVHV